MHIVAPIECSVAEGLGVGPALLAAMSANAVPVVTAVVIRGPAIVLGASQRAGRVIDLAAASAAHVPVFRRASSGTAAYIGTRAIVWTLCLPDVAALVPDATMRTLINRNIRGFLQGFTRIGALAQYFGREWLAVQHRPAALLGYETTRDGHALLEIIAGIDACLALPDALVTAEERGIDRWRGKDPLALAEVVRADREPLELARAVIEASAVRWSQSLDARDAPSPIIVSAAITDAHEPAPRSARAIASVPCAIGRIDAAWAPDRTALWLGGDALASRYLLEDIAAQIVAGNAGSFALDADAPLEGARLEDFCAAAREAEARL